MSNIYNINGVLDKNFHEFQFEIQSTVDNPNAQVRIDYDSDFQYNPTLSSIPLGTYDDLTKIWTFSLEKNQKYVASFYFDFNEPNVLSKEYLFTANILTAIDTDPNNNDAEDLVEYSKISSSPLGAANPDIFCTQNVDLSLNDTPCTQGVSKWIIDEDSITNSDSYTFDESTGKGCFKHKNPMLSITGKYKLICEFEGQEVEISCDVPFEVKPLFTNISFLDHVHRSEKYSSLSDEDKELLDGMGYSFDDDDCLFTLRNGEGTITSVEEVECSESSNLSLTICKKDTLSSDFNITELPEGANVYDSITYVFSDKRVTYEVNQMNKWDIVCEENLGIPFYPGKLSISLSEDNKNIILRYDETQIGNPINVCSFDSCLNPEISAVNTILTNLEVGQEEVLDLTNLFTFNSDCGDVTYTVTNSVGVAVVISNNDLSQVSVTPNSDGNITFSIQGACEDNSVFETAIVSGNVDPAQQSVLCCDTLSGYGANNSGLYVDSSDLKWINLGVLGSANNGVDPLSWELPLVLKYSVDGGTEVVQQISTDSGTLGLNLAENSNISAEIIHPLYGTIYSLFDTVNSNQGRFTSQGAWFENLVNCPVSGEIILDGFSINNCLNGTGVWGSLQAGDTVEYSDDDGLTWQQATSGQDYTQNYTPSSLPFKANVCFRIMNNGNEIARSCSYAVLKCN